MIAVIGASSAGGETLRIAEDVGAAIAGKGWHLVCGGGSGVMEAACRGFRGVSVESSDPATNLTIGILPVDDEAWANEYLDLVIPTGLGWARNALITRMASAVLAIGGCSGTLSEIAFAWQMGKPIVAMKGSGGWAEQLAGTSIDDRRGDKLMEASSAVEAMKLISVALGEEP